jgi:prepilin-type N-terminal cleavage/methylation domain-containing protein
MTRSIRGRSNSAFTLLEMVVALTIFTTVGYGLLVAVEAGNHSEITVARVSEQDRELRAATTNLCSELKSSRDASITITPLADSNHQIRFQQPIDDAGNPSWGVYDRTLGSTAAEQSRVGWFVQYTVRAVPAVLGRLDRQLVRQIVDDKFVVQKERVIADELCRGTDNPPGFRMIQTGGLWEITLSTTSDTAAGTAGIRAVFHVQTRN